MADKPFVSSMFYLPRTLIGAREFRSLQEEFTIEIDPEAASPGMQIHDEDNPEPKKVSVHAFDLSVNGYIGIPRYEGMQRYGHTRWLDYTVKGNDVSEAFRDLPKITPRNEQQERFFSQIANVCKSDEIQDIVAVAKTGAGKTTAIINGARAAKKPTLILVHTNRLKEQWLGSVSEKKGLRFFCGEQFVDDWVGVCQQGICDYKNKAFVIGMIQSVCSRQYPVGFYKHFGEVWLDELHRMSSPNFAKAIMLFGQRIRGGVTATMREDALKKISDWHFGPVSIVSQQKVQPSKVYEIRFEHKMHSNAFNTMSKGTVVNTLTRIEERNDILCKIIYQRGFLRGRQIVVMGDRVRHLQMLAQRVRQMGVPRKQIAIYTGEVYTGLYRCTVSYIDKEGKRRRQEIRDAKGFNFSTKHQARYAANKWMLENKITGKINAVEETYKPSDEWYRWMERNCSIFFATYGIFSTGNDISKLNMGLEATPRTDQRQSLGRILRLREDGTIAEWYSISDRITLIPESDFAPEEVYEDLVKDTIARRKRFKQQEAVIKQIKNISALLD